MDLVSSNLNKYKAIVIGLGRIGMKYGLDKKRKQPASHVSAILKNPDLDLVAVCDDDQKSRELFVKKYGTNIDIFCNYKELINKFIQEKREFDLVIISTPESTHYPILKYLINKLRRVQKSIIIFCEKPLTANTTTAKQIKKIQKNPHLKIVVNHSRRWSKAWQKAHIYTKYVGPIEKAAFYFSTSPENKEVVQIRDGIHIADLINWFDIIEKAVTNRLIVPYFIYDFYLWGANGKIEVLDNGETLKFFKVKKSSRYEGFRELKLVKKENFRESLLSNAYSEFVDFLRGNISSLSTNLDDAVEAVRVFEKYVYDNKITKTRGINFV